MSAAKNKKADSKPADNPAIDWERIEAEYRADVLSLREIAALHPGVSHTSIARKAKAEGWQKDLKEKIHKKAEQIVTRRAVTEDVTASDTKRAVTDKQVIEANAEAIANVRLTHRSDIRRYRVLGNQLLAELESQTEYRDLYLQLGDLLYKPDKNGFDKLNEIYHKVIGMPQRVDSMKKLAETLKTLITLEREAYGLTAQSSEDATAAQVGPAMSPGEAYTRMLNASS